MIKLIADVGAPAAVTAVDIVTLELAPDWNEWASYIVVAGGYVGGLMNFGGPFVKNVGIASMDWAARNLYQRIRGRRAGKILTRRTPGVIQRSYQPEFEAVAPHAF